MQQDLFNSDSCLIFNLGRMAVKVVAISLQLESLLAQLQSLLHV